LREAQHKRTADDDTSFSSGESQCAPFQCSAFSSPRLSSLRPRAHAVENLMSRRQRLLRLNPALQLAMSRPARASIRCPTARRCQVIITAVAPNSLSKSELDSPRNLRSRRGQDITSAVVVLPFRWPHPTSQSRRSKTMSASPNELTKAMGERSRCRGSSPDNWVSNYAFYTALRLPRPIAIANKAGVSVTVNPI
jgi:hypothetical protein